MAAWHTQRLRVSPCGDHIHRSTLSCGAAECTSGQAFAGRAALQPWIGRSSSGGRLKARKTPQGDLILCNQRACRGARRLVEGSRQSVLLLGLISGSRSTIEIPWPQWVVVP